MSQYVSMFGSPKRTGAGSRCINILKRPRRYVSTGNASSVIVKEPTRRQIYTHALTAAIPMIGFGFMDNMVMITAGEFIDASLGVRFGLSTITAAGFGQCISDVSGVAFGGYVDYVVSTLGLPKANLNREQRRLKSVRYMGVMGSACGVLTGCLLGMSCLFFLDTEKVEKMKKAKELNLIFSAIMIDGHKLLKCERSTLFLYDAEKGELWSQFATKLKPFRISSANTIAGLCVESQQMVNIKKAYEHPRFYPLMDKISGFKTQSVLSCPILNDDGIAVGCIQMVNREMEDGSIGPFNEDDERLLQMLANHLSLFIKHWGGMELWEEHV
eukprot:CFRG6094T1